MGGLNFKEGIVHYYLFQKTLAAYFNKQKYKEDSNKLHEGYVINPEWIKYWKKIINYNKIKNYLDELNINENISEKNKEKIELYLNNCISEEKINELSNKIMNNDLDITEENITSQKVLINVMEERVFKAERINKETTKFKIKYIFKKQMFILVLQDSHLIKIIIPDVSYFSENNDIVILSWRFNYDEEFFSKIEFLKRTSSEGIIDYLINKEIFANQKITSQGPIHILINENMKHNITKDNNSDRTDNDLVIKEPKDINFELAKKLSFRGLDSIGELDYMNPILQCFANLKLITDYLLDVNKYCEIYDNADLCPLTLQYCQLLFGLFCNESNNKSYSPKLFKTSVTKTITLFFGIQACGLKDFIIFLLDVLNKEISELHNKKHNLKLVESKSIKNIDKSNQKVVLSEFLNSFKVTHSSIIGANLCGFQKSIFTCQNCANKSINFNSFNFFVFDLEIISKHLHLNYNNNNIPILTFDVCFKFLLKEELYQEVYCEMCKLKSNSNYKESLYLMPNYLIIILERGKPNNFNYKLDIPLMFDSSNYEEKVKNKKYELIGIVSNYGEKENLPHYIAFCKNNIDNKWRCFNDSIVTESQNDFLLKGTPHILFYKYTGMSKNSEISGNNIRNSNNNPFNNLQNNNIFSSNLQANIVLNAQNLNPNINFNANIFPGIINMGNNFQGNFNANK